MTPEQELLSGLAKITFRLNSQFLTIGTRLAQPAGLTAATWQVLAAVLRESLPVAGIARDLGTSRQNVQRIADTLVRDGLAAYRPNPAHRRAKLLHPTEQGRRAVQQIRPVHAEFADRLATELGTDDLRDILLALTRLSAALATIGPPVTQPDAALGWT